MKISKYVAAALYTLSEKIKMKFLKLNSVALVRKRTIPTERPPHVGEVSVNVADRGCCVVSATDPHGR
jgi:hypothetical protein